MGRPFDHHYSTAPGSKYGTMICAGCGQPITEGEFRVYKRTKAFDWSYVTHHRTCCADDPAWATRERQEAKRLAHQAGMRAAAIAFRDRWSVDDLDELIEELSDPEGQPE